MNWQTFRAIGLFCLPIIISLSTVVYSQAQSPFYNKNYALVVGIDKYPSPKQTPTCAAFPGHGLGEFTFRSPKRPARPIAGQPKMPRKSPGSNTRTYLFIAGGALATGVGAFVLFSGGGGRATGEDGGVFPKPPGRPNEP